MAAAEDLTEHERQALGQWVTEGRRRRFTTKRAAYNAAGLNSATWDRIEDGKVVREDRLAAALRTLWPATGGDPQRLLDNPSLREPTPLPLSSTTGRPAVDPLLEQVRVSRSLDGGINITVPTGTPVHIHPV